ncbi:glycosyltransferase 87 family protein [Kineosporia sp. A_224]|uniref:glycosyltransferase 87 family protein n=1 Tax=Kineosporia sp. A_224 TaxID=1962180 RepID=UPI00117A7789|nr:glycosyltransferase 87 family protein [Kineosporia sp. A_224]
MSSTTAPVAVDGPPPGTRTQVRSVPWPRVLLLVGVLTVAGLALWARLAAVGRGAGTAGMQGYDDGVYFSAAEALAFGRMPYRDFVLLHPPGIVVAALPFGWLARLTDDPTGMAAARVAWAFVGAANAALVTVTARRFGVVAAVTAGALYAVWPPVVRYETSTYLEALGTLAVLGCLALLTARSVATRPRLQVAAGLALGLAPAVKIWGVVPVVVVLGWVLLTLGARPLGRVVAGAAASATLVCLPFFVQAPGAMWRMVVTDQLGRGSTPEGTVERLQRLAALGTIGGVPDGTLRGATSGGVVALCVAVVAAVLACTWREGALAVALTAACVLVVVLSPSFFDHYTSLVVPYAALVLAAAVGALTRWRPAVPTVVAAGAVATCWMWTASSTLVTDRPFPAAELRPALAGARCVTADSPMALVALDVLGRDLRNGCRVAIDVSGATYDSAALPLRPDGRAVVRSQNPHWQRYLMDYLGTGDATLLVRGTADNLSPASRQLFRSWPTVVSRGGYRVRAPRPAPSAGSAEARSRRTSASISS